MPDTQRLWQKSLVWFFASLGVIVFLLFNARHIDHAREQLFRAKGTFDSAVDTLSAEEANAYGVSAHTPADARDANTQAPPNLVRLGANQNDTNDTVRRFHSFNQLAAFLFMVSVMHERM